jgi:prevent-host-death family protein
MKTMVNIYDAKAHFSELIAQVERSQTSVIICRHNKPVAELVPRRAKRSPLKGDPRLSGAKFAGDPCAPLPREAWPEDLR